MLTNAAINATTLLHPPAYGFESIFRFPRPPPTPTPGTHFQHELRIDGAVPSSYSKYHLRVDIFIRGALWRTQQLRLAAGVLASINVCNLSRPLPPRLVAAACNQSLYSGKNRHPGVPDVSPDALMRSPAWREAGKSDLFSVDWRSIGTMFVLAALSLPQPFTIVESGNFCGGTTGFLSLLKRELCPACPYLSLDPGGYRNRRHAKFTCNRAALEFAGLSEQVTFVDDLSPIIDVGLPVGFVYMDGGKIRWCNEPLTSVLEDKIMVGGLLGLDDVWQASNLPHSLEHYGQIMLANELVQSGDWRPVFVPPAPSRRSAEAPSSRAAAEMMAALQDAVAPGEDLSRKEVLKENVKQALVVKARSRYEQPRALEGDALRVVLVERGGREEAIKWVELPPA